MYEENGSDMTGEDWLVGIAGVILFVVGFIILGILSSS